MFKVLVGNEQGSCAEYALTAMLAAIVLVVGLAFWGFAADTTCQDGPVEAGTEAAGEAIEASGVDEVAEEVVEQTQEVCEEICTLAFGPGGTYDNEHTFSQCLALCED